MNPQFVNDLDSQAQQVQQSKKTRMIWMPAQLNNDGTIDNAIQGRLEKHGPTRGHWAKDSQGKPKLKSGSRFWIEGQSNRKMQRSPKNPHETIMGTKLQNTNVKMQQVRDSNDNPVREVLDEAIILSYGMKRQMQVTTHDDIFLEASKLAKEVLSKTLPEQRWVNSGKSVSGGSVVRGLQE